MNQDIVERLRDRCATLPPNGPIRHEAADTIESLRARVAELESGVVCGDCDGSGWLQNRVEGRYPCTCMTEAEPYQLLQQQLAAKDQRIAELEEQLENEQARGIHSCRPGCLRDGCVNRRLRDQLAAKALTIKTMRTVLENFIDSHEECTDFDGFTAQVVSMDDYHEAQEALALPDNSTEVLQEWLDKQFGEPVVYGYRYTESGPIYWNPASIVINGESPIETIAAYRKPEIK